MIALHYFVTEPKGDSRYAAEKNGIIINSFEGNVEITNREVIVKTVPLNYKGPIRPGDTLLVHHNVLRHQSTQSGKRVNGRSFFDENTFLLGDDEFFMYKSGTKWTPVDRYCFVRPIPVEQGSLINSAQHQALKGMMVYPNEMLMKKGIKAGDIVGYTPFSEYEFEVDEEILYRVFDHQITLKY